MLSFDGTNLLYLTRVILNCLKWVISFVNSFFQQFLELSFGTQAVSLVVRSLQHMLPKTL